MGAKYFLVLFFFILYDLIVTFIFLCKYQHYQDKLDEKDDYIEKLNHIIANLRKK